MAEHPPRRFRNKGAIEGKAMASLRQQEGTVRVPPTDVVPPTKRLKPSTDVWCHPQMRSHKPSWRPPAHWDPLMVAVCDNDIHAVQVLLQHPNTVRQIDNGPIGDNRNALYHATQYHFGDIVKMLLQAKADPFKRIHYHSQYGPLVCTTPYGSARGRIKVLFNDVLWPHAPPPPPPPAPLTPVQLRGGGTMWL